MKPHSFDVIVIGSGFAGSLLATLLRLRGQRVALVEQGQHPRFAIGESSTPLADFKLGQISRQYGLLPLEGLTTYGRWRQQYPQVMCGPKRGFAYFWHQADQWFSTDALHRHELLVTANSSLEHADTHWLRADVDLWFLQQAIAAGVEYFDRAQVESFSHQNRCELTVRHGDGILPFQTDFVVIASGNPQIWQSGLRIPTTGRIPRTRSRTLFAHLKDVQPWQSLLETHGYSTQEYPFPCDQAALHHVFDAGWMWQLRFDHQVTSVGWMLDCERFPYDPQMSAQQEWDSLCKRFPSIDEQLSGTQVVAPEGGVRRIPLLQSELRDPSGSHWALLPAAIGFADPLYSTGIAHALTCVHRLADALGFKPGTHERFTQLQTYRSRVLGEIDLIDRLIRLAYQSSGDFGAYVAMTMLYFAASTVSETAMRSAPDETSDCSFLLADNPAFLDVVDHSERLVQQARVTGNWSQVLEEVERRLEPFNQVGLFRPTVPRMYRYTSAK